MVIDQAPCLKRSLVDTLLLHNENVGWILMNPHII
jgi:hypothetical protein